TREEASLARLRAQLAAEEARIKKMQTYVAPPTVGPPPSPPPPPPPPYVPPGPGWLSRTGTERNMTKGAVNLTINVDVKGTGDGKEIGKAIVAEIEDSARSGRLNQIILEVTSW